MRILFKSVFMSGLLLGQFPIVANAFTFDIRGGYNAGSHSYESRFKVSNGWDSGWWGSMEIDSKNNKNNGLGNKGGDKGDASHSLGDFTSDATELEVNYTTPLTDKWALQPGGILHWSNNGSQLRPYIRLNYQITPQWSSGIRYRYDYNNYETINSNGGSHRDSVNRFDIFLGYKLTPALTLSYQGTAYKHSSNQYNFKNHQTWATENAVNLNYKWNKAFASYVEYDYLDKQGYYKGQDNISASRYRVGVTFYF